MVKKQVFGWLLLSIVAIILIGGMILAAGLKITAIAIGGGLVISYMIIKGVDLI